MSIAETHFTAKLTYDLTSLVRMHPSLDSDNDQSLSKDELQTAVPILNTFLRSNIALELNGLEAEFGELQPVLWPDESRESIPASDFHAATSLVSFVYTSPLEKPPNDVWIRFDFFETLGFRHTVLGVIEHEGKEDEILFSAFEPDYFFETKYVPTEPAPVDVTPTQSLESPRRANESVATRLKQFFIFGVEHILIGYDHILFLLSLIVVSRFGELVKIVTAFTVAHSITLALATLRWVELPPTLVETLIALTIVYTASENFWIEETSGRWKLTFVFGLIHGFGFAGVLRELDLPAVGFLRSLLAFNLGVEAGQLVIVAVLALPIAWIVSKKFGRWFQRLTSAMIALCGLGWFLDRAFGLGFMPF